jgi:hypothetical protein
VDADDADDVEGVVVAEPGPGYQPAEEIVIPLIEELSRR